MAKWRKPEEGVRGFLQEKNSLHPMVFCLHGSLGGTEPYTEREAPVFGAAEPHTVREASVFGVALRNKLWNKGLQSPDGKARPA